MSNIESHLFSSVLYMARAARDLFPMNGRVPLRVLHHSGENPINAYDFLFDTNIDTSVLMTFMNAEGIWTYERSKNLNISELTAEETFNALENHASPLLDISMASLLKGHLYNIPNKVEQIGLFNDHTYRNHVYHAHRMVQRYLRLAGVTESQTLADAAAMTSLHDCFNFLSRSTHNILGARGVKRMFPNLTGGDKQRMRNIQLGILLHNEPIYREGPTQLRNLSFQDKVKRMREWHTPMSAALLLADKAEIRRRRANPQALNKAVIDLHSHTRANLYTNYHGLCYGDGVIEMSFEHNPWIQITDNLYSELSDGCVDSNNDQMYAPAHLKEADGKVSMKKVYQEVWKLYGPQEKYDADRFSLMIASGFVLFPNAHTFRMKYVHKYDQGRVIQHDFTLDNADEVLKTFLMKI